MANLGLIHFYIGLPININANEGQNKFEVYILKNVAKMTNYLPKMGQDTTFARTLNGHNLAFLHSILTNHAKMISSSRQIEWCKLLSSISFCQGFCFLCLFLLQGLTWASMGAWTKKLPKNVGTCPGHHLQLIARNLVFEIFRVNHPP